MSEQYMLWTMFPFAFMAFGRHSYPGVTYSLLYFYTTEQLRVRALLKGPAEAAWDLNS